MSTTENFNEFIPTTSSEVIPLATEYFRLSNGERFFEIANYTEPLTQPEVEQLTAAFGALSRFSRGKIFDKVSSVELHSRESLNDQHAGKLPELEGDYEHSAQRIRINLDFARDLARSADPGFSAFREKHFPNAVITPLQFITAHEAWHGMDVPSEDPATYADEAPLTKRAAESMREDFADSAAIAALGGDVSGIPKRMHLILQSIESSNGVAVADPTDIHLSRAA